jgi:hypothetical protein
MVDVLGSVLCVDEADKLNQKDNPELLGILNTGYEMAATVPRYNIDKQILEEFNAFSPKMLASNRALALSLESRCLRIPIMRSSNPYFAHREPKDPLNIAILEDIREDLVIWAMDQGSVVFDMDREKVQRKYEERFAGVPIRLFQVMIPLLCIFEALGLEEEVDGRSEAENMRKVIEALAEEKKASTIPETDQSILIGLSDSIAENGDDKLTMKEILHEIIGPEPDAKKEEAHYHGWLAEKKLFSAPKVGLILKKYNIPSRIVDGRKEYFHGKSQEARRMFVDELLQRFNVERSDLDSVLAATPEHRELDRYGDEDEH